MKKFIWFITLAMISVSVSAQDFEEWKRQQMEQFQQFKDERDKAFNEMLKKAWQAVNLEKGKNLIVEPKIVNQPVVQPDDSAEENEVVEIKVDSVIAPEQPVVTVMEPPKLLITEKPAPTTRPSNKPMPTLLLSFYSAPIVLPANQNWKDLRISKVSAEGISKFYEEMSKTDFEVFLKNLDNKRTELKLNDWSYAQLIEASAKETSKASQNEIRLFTWFFLLKSGYNAKIGYNDNEIYIMIPTQQRLYGTNYYTINGTKYYVVDFSKPVEGSVRLYTYDGSFPDANAAFDMRFAQIPQIDESAKTKTLKFTYEGKTYSVNAQYNAAYVNLVQYYPQSDLSVYFQAMISNEARLSMVKELKNIVADKDEYTQVNMLLRFVQSAFAYKTDEDQFGKEKYFFCDETIHYPFSDCEDRAILFASLVKDILGLDVIAVKYPGHLATAVAFNTNVKGDNLTFNKKVYTICDPTYKGADVGMSMPKFKSTAITVVPF